MVWPFLILSVLIVAADRILKSIVFQNFSFGAPFPLIKGILYITPTYNKGIAFGLFKDGPPFMLITILVLTICFILYLLLAGRAESLLLRSGLSLLLGGACGNLFDRAVYGHVLDFIDIRIWPVFNVADSSVTIGAGLILWFLLRGNQDVKRMKDKG